MDLRLRACAEYINSIPNKIFAHVIICVLSRIRSRYIASVYSDYPIRQKLPKNYRRLIRTEARFERIRIKGIRFSIYYLIYVK